MDGVAEAETRAAGLKSGHYMGRAAALAKLAEMRRSSVKMEDLATAEKDGFFTGRYAVNPFNGERVQIWVGNFVLMEYGTGAIMAVPGHDERDFEFATKFGLKIPTVVKKKTNAESAKNTVGAEEEVRTQDPHARTALRLRSGQASGAPGEEKKEAVQPFTEYGISVNSGKYSGLESTAAIEAMAADAVTGGFGKKETIFRLRDWGISRQRYWGTPIPVIYCLKDGMVAVPEQDLPVLLPANPQLTGEGRISARYGSGICECKVPEVWRCGPARNGHDGHLRGFVVVFLPVL